VTVWRNASTTTTSTSTSTSTSTTTGNGLSAGVAYKISPINSSNQNNVVDLPNGVTNSGSLFQLYAANGLAAQRMQFVQNGSTSKIVMNSNTNKCFDIGTANGSLLVLNDCNGASSQNWTVTYDGNAYQLKNAASNRCLDIPAGNLGNGTRPQLYDCQSGNNNQRFVVRAW
jgi:hypothetical protein